MSATHNSPLRILMMAAEVAPLAKTGQVAEVTHALAAALRGLGHDVRLAIPRYHHITKEQFGLQPLAEPFLVPLDDHGELATAYGARVGANLPIYLVDHPKFFGNGASSLYADDAERFIFYARATLELLKQPQVNWQPDVIHCHDWQTAIVPNWLETIYKDDPFFRSTGTVLTIHRLSHQGIFGYRVLEVAGLEKYGFLYHAEIADLADLVDLLGRGVYYADAITTVSRHYAQQIQTPEFGERLDPLFRERSDRLFGVTNGIDTDAFDPARDPHLVLPFDLATLERRAANKAALQRAFGLAQSPRTPLVGMVSRLSDDKGLDLFTGILDALLAHLDLQFAIVGVGEQKYHELLSGYARLYPQRFGLRLTFNDGLERQVYAGSDMFLMPSHVEPCGLGQMIAMRYGSVPIVHATGGLADTVQNYDPESRSGNGFSFEAYETLALYTAIVRASEIYRHPELWLPLQKRGMATDFSWAKPAAEYVEIYRRAQAAHLASRA